MSNILIIEDNTVILDTNKEFLSFQGYTVYTSSTIQAGKEILDNQQIELIVLDIMLPDGSGIDFCAEIRKRYDVPVLYLTCLEENTAIVDALKAGGDEYMTKPYNLTALLARIEALLRRVRIERSSEKSFTIGHLLIDCSKRKVFLHDEDVFLTPKEFDVLLLLARDVGKGFTAEEIYARCWGTEPFDSRTVIVHISSLRKKLRMDDESPLSISTEQRKFYSLRRE